MTNTVLMSLWRNDVARNLSARIEHLLAKTGVSRWVWIVGNSDDRTESVLRNVAAGNPLVDVVRYDSRSTGDSPDARMIRLSESANAGFDRWRIVDEQWCCHESDLISPVDVVTRLFHTGHIRTQPEHSGFAVAGWVTLGDRFYDTYAYRKNGVKFINDPPFHADITLDKPFTVDSAGSVLLFPAEVLRKGVRMTVGGLPEFCDKLRALDYTIWVDPKIQIQQPINLWTGAAHPTY